MQTERIRICYKCWDILFSCQKFCIALEAKVDKLHINKLVNLRTSLYNLKTKVDDLRVGKLKSATIGLKRLSDVSHNQVVKNKIQHIKDKVNNLEKKITGATTLIHIIKCNRDTQDVEK